MDWTDEYQVSCAVKRTGYALQYADESLKKNEKIVLEAVKQDGYALGYASEELRSNEEFVAECIYELYKENKKNNIEKMWTSVNKEIKEKYGNEWETIMASYYHRVQ